MAIKNKYVTYFKEKSKIDEGWINGGFFVINPKLLDYIKSSSTYFEREPLIKVSKKRQYKRFEIILKEIRKIANSSHRIKLADIGCGYGAMADYLISINVNFDI